MKNFSAKPDDLEEAEDRSQQMNASRTNPESAVQPSSVTPLYLRNQSPLSRSAAPRTILVSGGQTITVYGTFPPIVETAFADGWLSFREMDALWNSGQHMGSVDKEPHQMMEM